MNGAGRIFSEEWRYWSRSRLAVSAMLLLVVVILAAVISTVTRVQAADDARRTMQTAAEEAFLAQPARHPHRMVHYGHYVFRTPAPLAIVDPGVDPSHRHDPVSRGASPEFGHVSRRVYGTTGGGFRFLTPAFTYQVLVPLVLIVVGFSAVARERELQTDVQLTAQGVSPRRGCGWASPWRCCP